MRRLVTPELLDSDAGTAQEIQDSLADLRMVNRYFGGVRTTRKMIERVTAQCKLDTLRWLDVAGASGDVAIFVKKSLAKSGIQSQATVVDRAATHLNGAQPAVCGDALALPFRDDSFDLVSCSLFVHHLEPDEVVLFAREALRVARHGLLINDLVRRPAHLAAVYAGYALYRSRITRHDSVASVRRAYTVEEMKRMLEHAGAAEIEIRRFFLFRMGAIAWKRQPNTT
jgi:ubiquinone/menaquinone biosynthesis C-methylase UbiE